MADALPQNLLHRYLVHEFVPRIISPTRWFVVVLGVRLKYQLALLLSKSMSTLLSFRNFVCIQTR
jgi:hypothetical protein